MRVSELTISVLISLPNRKNVEEEMSDLDQIKALDNGVADAVNVGDAAAVTAHYTDDAAIHPLGAGRMDGKEAIQGY